MGQFGPRIIVCVKALDPLERFLEILHIELKRAYKNNI